MPKTKLLISLLCLTLAAIHGCATILSGTKQDLRIHSQPPGAHVEIGQLSGTTPCTLSVPKGKRLNVIVSLDSQSKLVPLSRRFDAVGLLNILVWPGFIVDAISGAIVKYHPDDIHVDFTEDADGSAS